MRAETPQGDRGAGRRLRRNAADGERFIPVIKALSISFGKDIPLVLGQDTIAFVRNFPGTWVG